MPFYMMNGVEMCVEALVGSGQTLTISTKRRGTFDTPDARKLMARGACGMGAFGFCSEDPRNLSSAGCSQDGRGDLGENVDVRTHTNLLVS